MAKYQEEEDGGKDIGDVIFGDLMSQMLIFFILLYIFAAQMTSKSHGESVIDIIRKTFNEELHQKENIRVKTVYKESEQKETKGNQESKEIAEKVQKMIISEKLEKYIDFIVEEKKVRLIFQQPVLFDTSSAVLKDGFKRFLDPVATLLQDMPNEVMIEGHTDNVPIESKKYESNWVLSFDRAYNVLKYIVQVHKINPNRISANGYGEFRPRAANDTEQNRAMNRRIEINILVNAKK
ncbi:MAG: flagellar motor protein MotB [Candidatus Margulisbacteria bacterium]|nr:flagellar motor protein MotB [Candidatus Margulisiibacteriota bacterium]